MSDRIGGIEVVHGDVNGFIVNTSISTAEAGGSFYITVTGATDAYGNSINDTAYVSITNSGIISTLNDVIVNNGTGSNSQVVFTSTTNRVMFKVRMGSVSNYIALSNITPTDEVGNLQLISSVSKVTAGRYINAPIEVRIYDQYNNLKYNATNSVYFFNTAADGIFTNSSVDPYQFVLSDSGAHLFSMSNFTYPVTGIRDLIVTNEQWGVSDRIGGIEVVAADVTGFFANLSVSTGIAGTSFYIKVTGATDAYGNAVSDTAYVSITNSSILDYTVNDIAVNSGTGSNVQVVLDISTNRVMFKVRIGSVSNYIALSNIAPTDQVSDIRMLSSVSKVTAGRYINAPVTVRIYDQYNNLKINATNSVYFFNTAADGIFTNASSNPYQFLLSDRGDHTFSMSNFMYTIAGTRDLIVTNEQWGVSDRIGGIEVVAADVTGFIANISVATARVGTSFYIKVTGATDRFGNAVSDTAYVSITNSDIVDYTVNNIVVNNGTGSNTQVISDASTNQVVFKIKIGGYSNYIALSNIAPTDEVANIQLLSSVTRVTAGRYINQPVEVRIYDLYNNIKYDATNTVYFKNTAGDGIFTNDQGNPYRFVTTDRGSHFFSMSNFMYTTTGTRDLIVTNEQWGVSDRVSGIEVVAADVTGFLANLSVSTAEAGNSFYIKVTGATDAYGNAVSDTAYVSITNSSILDYTVNDIAVNSGAGSNVQVVLDTSTNRVMFKVRIGSVSNYIALSNIQPTDQAGDLQLISSVTKVTAGKYINAPVTVRVYDLYDNLKINATNHIYFFNTAADGIFTNARGNTYQFITTDRGVHTF
ncbi:MAG: hypothetical protein ACXADY_27070, partial [Candidatus Hodarchaeales archaeon]